MKKSQILAALALAFALGVVTPVAGLVNTASAISFEQNKESASATEVNTVVAAVEAESDYEKAADLITAYNEYLAGRDASPAKYAEFDQGWAADIALAMTTADPSLATDSVFANVSGPKNIEETQALINAVNNNPKYKAMTQLNEAMANADNKADTAARDALIAALNSYYAAFGTPIANQIKLDYDTDKDAAAHFSTLKAEVLNRQGLVAGNPDHMIAANTYDNVTTDVEKANANINKFNAGKTLLEDALNPKDALTSKKVLSRQGQAQLENATSLSALANIIKDNGAYQDSNFNFNLTKWAAVVSAAANAANPDEYSDTYDNFKMIETIAKAYKDATDSEDKVSEIIEKLIAYVPAPEDPEDPTDPTDPVESTLNDGDVTVSGAFPEGTTLKATKLDKKVAAFGENKYALYDIVLLDADGKALDFKGNINVTIKSPADIDGNKAGVFYVAENGEVKKIEAQFANGYFSFTTNQLGNYAIVENPDTVKVGDTGILGSAQGTASTTISVVAGLATALTALGAGVVAYRNARRGE